MIILYGIACAFLLALGAFVFIYFSIKNRGSRLRLKAEHRPPGYRGWKDPAPIPHPRYDIWLKIIGGLILFSGVCGGVAGFVAAANANRGSEDQIATLPTLFVAAELTAETTPDLIAEATEELTIEPTATTTFTDKQRGELSQPQHAFVVTTPTLDIWSTLPPLPTYTPYPTYTPQQPIVERLIVTSPPITIRQPAPPPIEVVITSPPEIIYIPTIQSVVVTATITPTYTPTVTVTPTYTPTVTVTPTYTPTVQVEVTDGV